MPLVASMVPVVTQPRTNGHLVRAIRRARGLQQNEVADLADIHKGYLSRVEKGERFPLERVTQRIADALDVAPRVLTGQIPPYETLRKLEHLTVRDLAQRCGITTTQLQRIEQGTDIPSPELAAILAARLGCDTQALLPVYGPAGGKVA